MVEVISICSVLIYAGSAGAQALSAFLSSLFAKEKSMSAFLSGQRDGVIPCFHSFTTNVG